jgi:methionyl-tRNA formyltransferase
MRLVFLGTPQFAVPALDALLAASEVAAVVTRPDRPQGRGLRVAPPPVAVAAAQYALEVLQPATLRDPAFLARLAQIRPDLLVVVAFGRLVPPQVLAAAPHGGINLHPSLLPRYRGAAPIPRAIAAGETETGVTVLHMSDELDAGDIILQRRVPIRDDDTSGTLEARLAEEGAGLLVEAVGLLEAGRAPRHPQDASQATYAPKLRADEARIRWTEPAKTVVNLVRAFDPWPVAYTLRDGDPLKIWRAADRPGAAPGEPGTVLPGPPGQLIVAAGQGTAVEVREVQPASGRRMPAADYLRGHPLPAGARFA